MVHKPKAETGHILPGPTWDVPLDLTALYRNRSNLNGALRLEDLDTASNDNAIRVYPLVSKMFEFQ